jgi:site-specific recombinase XerD
LPTKAKLRNYLSGQSELTKAEHYGPHSIRHACATTLLRRGVTLKDIGDVLGHRVPEATLIYCKLAVEDLRLVALDIPEVQS